MRLIILACLVIIFNGCQPQETSDDATSNNEPLSQKNEIERKPDYTGYEISKKRLQEFKKPKIQTVKDEYSTKRSQQIAQHLNEMDEINRSQVVETEDKIIAGVILNLHADKQLADVIEMEIRKFANDEKEIVVYTDYTYWYRRIDNDASAGATEIGEDLESFFDQFFNIAD